MSFSPDIAVAVYNHEGGTNKEDGTLYVEYVFNCVLVSINDSIISPERFVDIDFVR